MASPSILDLWERETEMDRDTLLAALQSVAGDGIDPTAFAVAERLELKPLEVEDALEELVRDGVVAKVATYWVQNPHDGPDTDFPRRTSEQS